MSDELPKTAPEEQVSAGARSVVQILHYLFWGLRLLMVLIIVGFLFSGIFMVASYEHALLFRFGKLIDVKEDSKLYFAWPKPVERYLKFNVKESKRFESTNFWYEEQARNAMTDPNRNQQENHDDPLEPGKGGYLLTGDYNILHTKWSVEYHISDAKAYHLNYAVWTEEKNDGSKELVIEAARAIEFALRNAVLKTASGLPINEALENRGDIFRVDVADELRRQISKMEIGIEVDRVLYLQNAVPRSTKAAFDELHQKSQTKEKLINKAEGYRKRVMQEAEGEAAKIVAEAEAYKEEIQNSVEADAEYLEKIEEEYRESPAVLLNRYIEALTEVVDKAEEIVIIYPDQEVRVTIEPRHGKGKKATDPKNAPPGGATK